jgi:hypothetical protein
LVLLTDMVLLLENDVAGQRFTDSLLSLAAAGRSDFPSGRQLLPPCRSMFAVIAEGNAVFSSFPIENNGLAGIESAIGVPACCNRCGEMFTDVAATACRTSQGGWGTTIGAIRLASASSAETALAQGLVQHRGA